MGRWSFATVGAVVLAEGVEVDRSWACGHGIYGVDPETREVLGGIENIIGLGDPVAFGPGWRLWAALGSEGRGGV